MWRFHRCQTYNRFLSSSAHSQTIGSVFSQSAHKNSSTTALVASHQRIRLDYGRLYSLSVAFASALSGLRYNVGDRIALNLKNDSENLIAQLGCSMIGVAVVTAKDTGLLAKACSELMCKGLIVDSMNSTETIGNPNFTSLSHPMIVTGNCAGLKQSHLAFDALLKSPLMVPSAVFPPSTPIAYYGNTSKPVTHSDLIRAAQSVLMELRLGGWDRVCVPVTLNHTFGFGSGALAALTAGATLVLPSPGTDPAATVRALDEEGCTVFLTDSHVLAALRPLTLAGPANLPWWAAPGYVGASAGGVEGATPRAGLVKVGSGDALGLAPLAEWCGVPLTSVGNPPA